MNASNQEHQLIQSVKKGDQDFDLNLMLDATYIETMDISSPIIIFNFNDRFGYLREGLSLEKFDEITVSIGDPHHTDDNAFVEKFTILSMPMRDDFVLKINAIQSDVFNLYKLQVGARMFTKKSGISVIKKLINNSSIKFIGAGVPVIEDYHLMPSMRPISLVKQISQERGRLSMLRRGEFLFDSLETMKKQDASFTYHHNDTSEKLQIEAFKSLSLDSQIKDKMDRTYSGFDIRNGYIESNSLSGSPVEHTGLNSTATLGNMHLMPIPVVDVLMLGNLSLKPSMKISMVWNRNSLEEPIDESMPSEAVISRVSHHYSANVYQCRTLLVT